MKFFRSLVAACSLFLVFSLHASPSDDPDQTLRGLVDRQKTLLATGEKDDPNFDNENFRSQVQQLCDGYELLLKDHPKFVAGYIAYGLLLGKIDMRRESTMMFLSANRLDQNIPVVKNQLGNYLAEEGKPLDAVNYFLAAIKLAPNEPLYHYQLGTLLSEARDDFIKTGDWSRESIDKATHEAFRRAMELSPGSLPYAYRYGESFYDLEHPDWNEALAFWHSLEKKSAPGIERQTIQLHEANVLIKQEKFSEAEEVIQEVDEKVLDGQKQKLVAQLPTPKAH